MSEPVDRADAPRAVVLVGNPAAPYSRGLRVARALDAAGYRVEIAAVAADGVPEREQDGRVEVRRYRPSGPYASMAATYGARAARTAGPPVRRSVVPARWTRRAAAFRRWLLWPHTVRGWWATLERDLAPADLYHACGSLAIAPALAARRRDARAGRRSVVVYDAIDDVFEGNNVLDMPAPLRAWHARREAGWARAADARTTVNEALAARLPVRWGMAAAPLVVPNWPEPWNPPPGPPPDRIRAAAGLAPTTRVVLFEGRLGPNLGLDEAAEAVLAVPDAALVLIGFGRWTERCRARDADPRFAGRHVTLAAVHPDQLVAWTASADVALVPLPPVSLNQRLATPNKFWEALAAGTPVVVGPGLPAMAELVEAHDLGRVAASLEPEALAASIAALLDRPAAEQAAHRARIAALSRERFSWPAAAAAYRELVAGLAR